MRKSGGRADESANEKKKNVVFHNPLLRNIKTVLLGQSRFPPALDPASGMAENKCMKNDIRKGQAHDGTSQICQQFADQEFLS